MGVAYSAHTRTRSWEREDGASCQLRYSITEDSNTHDRFTVALSAPGVGVIGHVPREFSRVVRHFLLHGGTLTCKVSGRRQYGKGLEVPCLYTCLRCAAVDRSRYRAIFFDQKRTKDRKKGCAYDPGALMTRVHFKTRLYGIQCCMVIGTQEMILYSGTFS